MNFCPKCGQPIDQATGLCPVCGDVSAPPERTIPESKGFAAVLKKKLGSPLLLWFCIIYTILTFITVGILGASFVGIKEADTSSVIAAIVSAVVSLAFLVIMLTAFWRVYFAAKSPEEEMRLGGLKTLSVIITIERVLVWIGTALILLFAALCFFAPSFVADTSNFSAEFAEIEGANIAISDNFPFYFSGIMMIIIAVLMILINIFYYGSIKKSIVSVIDSFKS
ncbi:MAG: hypothetical protein IJL71_02295, partial [Oscillospiraceae bacterium]|nr:hypothetical protein [Oscillospiraceae bacterium]